MLLAVGRRGGRPGVGRPADAVALGHTAAQHRHASRAPTGSSASRRSAAPKPALIYERVTRAFPTASRSSTHDEVTYVSLGEGATSEGEFWEA